MRDESQAHRDLASGAGAQNEDGVVVEGHPSDRKGTLLYGWNLSSDTLQLWEVVTTGPEGEAKFVYVRSHNREFEIYPDMPSAPSSCDTSRWTVW